MKKLILIFIILGFAAATRAEATGFTLGNQFYSIHLHGRVEVYCGAENMAIYTCNDIVLDPASYDYFIGPKGIKAENIFLTNTRADGSQRSRNGVYNSSISRSADAFNLWISTPFQRPLLALGVNKIDYKLVSTGKIANQGSFSVNITHGEPRTCPTTYYNSTDINDCQSQYTICQKYFEQYDYCR